MNVYCDTSCIAIVPLVGANPPCICAGAAPPLPFSITALRPSAAGIAANAADIFTHIDGTGFTPNSQIMLDGVLATTANQLTFVSETELTFYAKPALETVPRNMSVTVVEDGQTSNAEDFRFIWTPTLSMVDPPCGMWDGPPHQFTLTGANFTQDTQFTTTSGFEWFDLQPGMLISSTEIRTHPMVLSFAEPMKQVQVRDKTVTVPTSSFPIYLFPTPTLTSISPTTAAAGASFTLHVTGTGFAPSMRDCATQVLIDGIPQAAVEITSTTAEVRVGPGSSPTTPKTSNVTVVTVAGYVEATTSLPFIFT